MKQSTRFPNPHHLKLEDKDSGQKALPTGQILVGDAVERLRQLPSRSVNTVITSPPYFRLRNYQAEGQLGAEETVQQWVEGLLAVMEELARVLRDDGTVWLNLETPTLGIYSTAPRQKLGVSTRTTPTGTQSGGLELPQQDRLGQAQSNARLRPGPSYNNLGAALPPNPLPELLLRS